MIGLTYEECAALHPCRESLARAAELLGGAEGWNGNRVTAAAARDAGIPFGDILWVAGAMAGIDPDIERRLRRWMDEVGDTPGRGIREPAAAVYYAANAVSVSARCAVSAAARGDAVRGAASSANAAAWAAIAAEEARQLDLLVKWLSDEEEEGSYYYPSHTQTGGGVI